MCQLPRSSGTSRRSVSNPLGEEKFKSVRDGNVLCCRTLIVMMIAASLQTWWLIEQPRGSWMESHPCFQDVLKRMDVWRHHIRMGQFGAKSIKPTWLYSSPWDCYWDTKFVLLVVSINYAFEFGVKEFSTNDNLVCVNYYSPKPRWKLHWGIEWVHSTFHWCWKTCPSRPLCGWLWTSAYQGER